MREHVLEMWTVYDHPTDFPDWFVARQWIIGGNTYGPGALVKGRTLEEVRAAIQEVSPNSGTMLSRSPEDDPRIVEVWI